jgi:ureidoglycolate dehydrogenase (NAD+)
MVNGAKLMFRLDAERLKPIFTSHLCAVGVDRVSAEHVVGSLLQTSLRGVDSHGIQLFPHYVRAASAGRINIDPHIAITASGASTAILDADHAFGHRAGANAIDHAVELAAKTGVGVVSVRHSSHFGAAAYFALRAAERGFIGFSFTNADSLVKAFNAREAVFGTNPICFAAPLMDEGPLCLDMATSIVSWNKVRVRQASGLQLEPGWAYDGEGMPTTDPAVARSLSPAGGYKGYGLGMMVEILCGLIAGGPIGREILTMYGAPIEARRSISHFLMAIDVGRFVDKELFCSRLQGLVGEIRSMQAVADSVMVPGDPEKRMFVERAAAGIPVPAVVFDSLCQISDDFRDAVRS